VDGVDGDARTAAVRVAMLRRALTAAEAARRAGRPAPVHELAALLDADFAALLRALAQPPRNRGGAR
jgi:hypothetical protein